MESTDPTTIGFTFTVSEDKSVKRYEICIGTDKYLDNIFPCTWVGYNTSGSASIKDGYLYIDDIKLRPLSELKTKVWNISYESTENKTSVFHMEPGRTLFMTMRVCNEAVLCTNKSIGSVLITNTETVLKTSEHGESIEIIQSVATNSTRKKRDTDVIVVTTPEGLEPGQTVVLQPISEKDLNTEYRSDSSTDFQPYIVNPATSFDMVERLLYRRIYSYATTFSVIPVGHLSMPGPMNITYPDTLGENEDNRTVLAHWNTAIQQWELSGRTCGDASVLDIDNDDGTKTVQVCKTWRGETEASNETEESILYFSEETQFAVFIVSNKVYNSAPTLISNRFISITEDQGTVQYQLEAADEEDDTVRFYLATKQTYRYKLGAPVLYENGLLMYTPCKDCSGVETIDIILREILASKDITPASRAATLVITIIDTNDPPDMFLVQNGQSILLDDPTEPVMVYLEQKTEYNRNKWMEDFRAVIGAFDVEQQHLIMEVYKPMSGTVMFTEVKTTVPDMYDCETDVNAASEPCGNFSYTLPHDKGTMSWIYTTLTYKQSINVTGKDYIKFYVSDSMNASSSVVTVQFVLMESPCHNDGFCQPKNGSNYPCTSWYRANNFDQYFECVCLPGWIGVYCEENIDECISSPCMEPFECVDGVNKYECRCPVDDPNCDLKIWIIPVIVLSVVCLVIIIIVVICRYWKKRVKNKKAYRDLLNQSTKDLLSDDLSREFSFAKDTVQVDFQESHDDLANLDLVGILNPVIGKTANPRWKNKVYPESSRTKKFLISPAEQKSESKLKEEIQEKDDLKNNWTYSSPVHQALKQAMKPIAKPHMKSLKEIKLEVSSDNKNTEPISNPTEERKQDTEVIHQQAMPSHFKPMYQAQLAKPLPTTGLVAQNMSYSRYNEKQQLEKSSDA
ncbi:uncharacterized protein LOC127720424 [Mytilus californianus]|uniref:uncharacterized protein LOC127720424 n=1 Tax=Mytilus californianus TaxID=6549 RepID=UPI002248478E|nr:uncharacterized protein LOC127720424 [Mytilus californianus]